MHAWLVHRVHGVVAHRHYLERELTPKGQPSATLTDESRLALENGENDHVEFKPFVARGDKKAEELTRTIAAFANTNGGRLFIGVTDEGEPEGRSVLVARYGHPDRAQAEQRLMVLALMGEKLAPVPPVDLDWIIVNGEPVLVASVRHQPAVWMNGHDLWIRRGGTTRRAGPEESRRLSSEFQNGGAFSPEELFR